MPTRIVILGGGFAGVYAAKRLLKRARRCGVHDLEVHLVNRENYLVFQPMLPEVISGSVGLADTVSPIRRLVPGVKLHMRDVESIDTANRTVTCSPGLRPKPLILPYDHLIVALGNVTDFRGMTGLAEHAMPFKTLGDALALRNHIIRLLDEADTETNPEIRKQMLTFVVAGGGFSGVEVIAELHSFVRRITDDYANLKRDDCRFILLHSRDRILPEVAESLGLYAQRLLQKRGVEMMLNTRLAAATGEYAMLGDGTRIPTKTLVATVPSSPNPVIEAADLPKDKGRLIAESTTRVKGSTNVWTLGDCALIPMPDDKPDKRSFAPPTAQHAIREAAVCADNILASITNKPLRPFTFKGLGSLAALGHRRGVAQVFGVKLSGFFAWWMWRTIYLAKLPGLDRKIRVAIAWTIDLIFPPDLVQLRIGKTSGVNHEHFEPGQFVFEQGDLGDRVYIIMKGKAEVLIKTGDNGEAKKVAEIGPGQYFGEMALLHRRPRSATIRCTEPMDLMSIEKGDFTALVMNVDAIRTAFEAAALARGEK
ncbi:MAG: FAD-dependent oxidoreductase [Planctomycetes bacterium]|nr:FAD-dependent oxidoreductase [Planctomycetota bacterium]